MNSEEKKEYEKMEKVLSKLKESLFEIDLDVLAAFLEKEEIVKQMTPLVAAAQTIETRLGMLYQRKDILLREYGKGMAVNAVLKGKEAREVYIG